MIDVEEEKRFQIPFRYGKFEAEQLDIIKHLQNWKEKKNIAICDALNITCRVIDIIEDIEGKKINSIPGLNNLLQELETYLKQQKKKLH